MLIILQAVGCFLIHAFILKWVFILRSFNAASLPPSSFPPDLLPQSLTMPVLVLIVM